MGDREIVAVSVKFTDPERVALLDELSRRDGDSGRNAVLRKGLDRLVGLRVERGVMSRIHKTLGGPRGCAHMVELITDAVRLLAMLLSGTSAQYWDRQQRTMSDEELIASTKEKLRNSCLVFADPDEE